MVYRVCFLSVFTKNLEIINVFFLNISYLPEKNPEIFPTFLEYYAQDRKNVSKTMNKCDMDNTIGIMRSYTYVASNTPQGGERGNLHYAFSDTTQKHRRC